jgi:acetyltransferase
VTIGVHVDSVFGPVITLGASRAAGGHRGSQLVLLPPLNERLAGDFVRANWASGPLQDVGDGADAMTTLARVLVQVSALVCTLPWLRSVALDPVRVGDERAEIVTARITIDPRPAPLDRPYGHMAIHPYPVEQVADVTLRDGTPLHVRPIRPEDAEMERAFVAGLSDQSRYFRFFYQLHELTPAMVARFTQIDYDREMALVAVEEAHGAPAIVGVVRYIVGADPETAEFAVVVADAWQNRGVGRMLMARLVDCAKGRGIRRIEGAVLRGNPNMLRFVTAFGFTVRDDPDDGEQVIVTLDLGSGAPAGKPNAPVGRAKA